MSPKPPLPKTHEILKSLSLIGVALYTGSNLYSLFYNPLSIERVCEDSRMENSAKSDPVKVQKRGWESLLAIGKSVPADLKKDAVGMLKDRFGTNQKNTNMLDVLISNGFSSFAYGSFLMGDRVVIALPRTVLGHYDQKQLSGDSVDLMKDGKNHKLMLSDLLEDNPTDHHHSRVKSIVFPDKQIFRFIMAHEFAHLLHEDNLTDILYTAGISTGNILAISSVYKASAAVIRSSTRPALRAVGKLSILGIGLISQYFCLRFVQHGKEFGADRRACEVSSEMREAGMRYMEMLIRRDCDYGTKAWGDFYHPSPYERLERIEAAVRSTEM